MAKKFVVFILAAVIPSCLLYSIDMQAKGQFYFMSGYGDFQPLRENTSDKVLLGYAAEVVESEVVPGAQLNIGLGMEGAFDLYFSGQYIPYINYYALYSTPLTLSGIATSEYTASQMYAGLGVMLKADFTKNFRVFLSGDAGFSILSSKTTDINLITSQKTETTGSVSGFSYNAGGGARVRFDGLFVELTGEYCGAMKGFRAGLGLGYDFGAGKAPKSEVKKAPLKKRQKSAYEKYGDYYLDRYEYANAIKYYAAAFKKDRSDILCIRMAGCYYAMKNIKMAVRWYEYSLNINDDEKVREYVKKLKAYLNTGGGKK